MKWLSVVRVSIALAPFLAGLVTGLAVRDIGAVTAVLPRLLTAVACVPAPVAGPIVPSHIAE